jgi:hypothetical protein
VDGETPQQYDARFLRRLFEGAVNPAYTWRRNRREIRLQFSTSQAYTDRQGNPRHRAFRSKVTLLLEPHDDVVALLSNAHLRLEERHAACLRTWAATRTPAAPSTPSGCAGSARTRT